MIGLIDGDILVYSTCFACADETEWWKVRHTANQSLNNLMKGAKATQYIGFLTHGGTNFRIKRAVTWPYKGDRKTNTEKPRWYKEVREHYMKQWKFQMMKGIEADDALTICAEIFSKKKLKWIICTKDKDLWQYAGSHYDMNKKKRMRITKAEGHKNLWKQVLLGDVATDNIPGLSHAAFYETASELHNLRISLSDRTKSEKLKAMRRASKDHLYGETTVNKLLDSWNPEDYARNIFELYVDAYWCPDHGEQRFYETFDLVFMLRELPEGVTLDPTPIAFVKAKAPTEINNTASEFEDESENAY